MVRLLVVLLFCLLSFIPSFAEEPAQSETAEYPHQGENPESEAQARQWGFEAGAQVGSAVISLFGEELGMKNNLVAPMVTGAAMLSNLSGTEEATIDQMQQRSSNEFVSLFIVPLSTGDVSMTIRVDKDFDGFPEYSFSPEFAVSGVCSNGLITCPPGTWGSSEDHCEYYKWSASIDADVGTYEVSRAELAGCYCINNDCGTNLAMANARAVLRDLGGGIIAGIQEKNPQYMITDAEIDSLIITYYGNDTTASANYDTDEMIVGAQSQHFEEAWSLESDATAEALEQSADPDSDFSMLQKAFENQGTTVSNHNCTIARVIAVNPVEDFCWDPDIAGVILKQEEVTTYYKTQLYANKKYNDDCDYAYASIYPDYHWLPESGGPYQILPVIPPDARPTGTYNYDLLYCDKEDGTDEGHYDIFQWSFICERTTDFFTEEVVDNCASYAANPDCALSGEVVDTITTAGYGNPTGIFPLPTIKQFPGALDLYDVERNWWRKDRTYECRTQENFNFGDINQRLRNIHVEMSPDGSWDYTDGRLLDDGTWSDEHYYFDNPGVSIPKAGCQYGCKVRKLVSDTDAGLLLHVAHVRSTAQTWDFRYRTCRGDNICPAEDGEQVYVNNSWVPANTSNNASACQCLNEFADAASSLLTVRMAGNDMICSDGSEKEQEPVAQLPSEE